MSDDDLRIPEDDEVFPDARVRPPRQFYVEYRDGNIGQSDETIDPAHPEFGYAREISEEEYNQRLEVHQAEIRALKASFIEQLQQHRAERQARLDAAIAVLGAADAEEALIMLIEERNLG